MRTLAAKKPRAKSAQGLQINHMLVALELGIADDTVLEYLDFLTAHLSTRRISLLHVLPSFDLFQAPFSQEAENVIGQLEFNQEIIEEMRRRIQQHEMARHSTLQFNIREGNPLGELLETATEGHADLLVIGQRSDISDHGILASNLIRKSKTKVLMIPEGSRPQLRHIIVPVDFSPYSVQALQTAVALKKALKEPVRITCLHVYELPNLNIYLIEKIDDVRRIVQEDRQASFLAFLHQFAPEVEDHIVTQTVERQFGSTASYIYDFAVKEAGDFIIMGAKGHSPVERMLLGSVTERLIGLNDSIPTLIVR